MSDCSILSTLEEAVQKLCAGGLVAFPTETVYGLGADACNPQALARLYAAKGRPTRHPVIVHLAKQTQALTWVRSLPDAAQHLMEQFWPGPLTLILPKATHVLDAVTGGLPGVGLRVPQHPVALALLNAFRQQSQSNAQAAAGLAAPSANRFGRISPTRSAHVAQELDGFLDPARDGILEGGSCRVGLESTIVDFSDLTRPPRLLRPGGIGIQALQEALHGNLRVPAGVQQLNHSGLAPGTLATHYAPTTPLLIVETPELMAHLHTRLTAGLFVGVMGLQACPESLYAYTHTQKLCDWVTMPATADAYAQALYHQLRQLDSCGAGQLLIEAPPKAEAWRAVWDRIQRAAS